MISKSGSQPQISQFLYMYIGSTVKYRSKFSFSSKKSYKYMYHNLTGFLAYNSGKWLF